MEKQNYNTGRSVLIYTLTILIFSMIAGACTNPDSKTQVDQVVAYDINGRPILAEKAVDGKEQLNFTINLVQKAGEDEDHGKSEYHRNDASDGRGHDNVDVEKLQLVVVRVDGYTALNGWATLYDGSANEAAIEPVVITAGADGDVSELGSFVVPNGDYEKVRIYLGSQNYFTKNSDPLTLIPLELDGDDNGAITVKAGNIGPVSVISGFKTTVMVQADVQGSVERERKADYKLELEDLKVTGFTTTPLPEIKKEPVKTAAPVKANTATVNASGFVFF